MAVASSHASADEWAAIKQMRRVSRPVTSSPGDDNVRKRVVVKGRPKQKAVREEEPQHDDVDFKDEFLFRAAPPLQTKSTRPLVVRLQTDGTSQLTSLLGSAEEKLREQLLIASEKGKKHAVYLLLHQCGAADRDRCRGMRGYTPLHHAATRGHLDVLQLLVEFGWSVDTRNDALETPLHLASYNGHAAIVEFLLDKGADVNALTNEEETPLFYAARKNHYRIVRLLIRRECDLSLKNRFDDVAQDEATSEKTLMEFAVGREDVSRLYRRSTISSFSSKKTLPSNALLSAFHGEVTLAQKQRELVLSFLDLRSLCLASQVSYRWHRASDSPALWRHLGVSRWELLLQTTVGIGAVAPMTLMNSSGRLQLSTASLIGSVSKGKNSGYGSRRPSSCDTSYSIGTSATGLNGSRAPAPRERSGSLFLGDHRRPQTARVLAV